MTRRLPVDPLDPDPSVVEQAAAVLRAGRLVAFPTETVYGLGADATSADAVRGIFAAKGRPADNPLIVHLAVMGDVQQVTSEVSPVAERLMDRFWPGPLTLVLPKADALPDVVTAGHATVAVRMPEHPVARALIAAAGRPVAAPSANLSGRPSPTTARHVLDDLDGRIDLVLDAGPCRLGLESTVVAVDGETVTVLRLGGVTTTMLETVVGPVQVHPSARGLRADDDEAAPSPGMRHRHYAPRAEVRLFEGDDRVEALRSAWAQARDNGRNVGVLATTDSALSGPLVHLVAARNEPDRYARGLYAGLRALEAEGVDVILVEGIEPEGIGAAVLDRLRRAAER